MASRKQVETKATKLGGKLIATRDSATLISPAGFHWDGYHSQVDYFDDGKQETWDYFWIAINKQEPCDCESATKEPKELTEWDIKVWERINASREREGKEPITPRPTGNKSNAVSVISIVGQIRRDK